jgi:quercetin dioxygenase-like cupin family protein
METPLSQYRARPPALATLILDDAVVRITQWDFEPGADTDCQFLIEDAEGSRRVDIAKGAAYRREAGTEHNVVNAGDQPMSFIEIEYK